MKKSNILGFDVLCNDSNLLNSIFEDIDNNEKCFIVNINPFIIMNFYQNKRVIDLLNQQKYQIPDGIGIVYASKGKIKKRISGIDLMEDICKRASKCNKKIFLCGASESDVVKCKDNLEKRFDKINICGYINGYKRDEEMMYAINKAKPDILFVALGSPKQEEFILKHKNNLNAKVIMPVGGAFDVFSGKLKRAPKLFIDLHLEWLYRMIIEPKRIRRNLSLVKFVFLVLFNNK